MQDSKDSETQVQPSNILDTIIGSQTQMSLTNFDPIKLTLSLLGYLKGRDSEIVAKRFGLKGFEIETLESIGHKHNLTRERVRQIEKDSLNLIKSNNDKSLEQALQLIFDTLSEHGQIMAEDYLLQTMLLTKSGESSDLAVRHAITFLLNLGVQFSLLKESDKLASSWYLTGFDLSKLEEVVGELVKVLHLGKKTMDQTELFNKFKQTDYFNLNAARLSDKVLKSYIAVTKLIQVNPFNEVGLVEWTEIKPHDVGDKAYLVLKHHGKPEHYSAITQLINESKFDQRTAYQETVHNELIKDERFVLVGRGIYALAEWGYKKGVVADVIKEVLTARGHPLSRDEIINEVMKKRMVKRNTILVGLSNRKLFKKVENQRYTLP